MDTLLFYWLSPFIFFLFTIFLSLRFKFFSAGDIAGRVPFFIGSFLLLLAMSWNSIVHLSTYAEWFVPSAYPIIEIVHLSIFLIGSILAVVGLVLFADFWQTQKNEIETLEQKLTLLNDLQHDARDPYHLMELFDLSLKEIVANVDETVGAIFLLNRNRRQLVLASSVGLSKNNQAQLEQYPLGKNIITQSIELGEPMIAGDFLFVDHTKKLAESTFNSTLVLPMVSGSEKIGVIVLLSEQKQFFSRTEIKFLAPVAEWLAEKVKSTKLSRELTLLQKEKEKLSNSYSDLNQRLFTSSASLYSTNVIESYCRSLVGIAESKSVHLFGMKNGSLQFYGGSEPLLDLSENFKTALIEGLDKKKPLILNQETTSEEGRTYIAKSSLIFPIITANSSDALLFIKESKAFSVDEGLLKSIEIFANLARISLQAQENQALNVTRRKGLDKIISLLRFENSITFESNQNYFIEHLSKILPAKSIAVTFEKQVNGQFKAADGFHVDLELLHKFEILPGEGFLGNMNASLDSVYLYGKNNVGEAIKNFDEHNRTLFYKLFGERGLPSFLAICPIFNLHGLVGATMFCMFAVSEEERGEWQKLLTLASGLYSIRLTINQLKEQSHVVTSEDDSFSNQLGRTVNRLNNHLSAIIGNAELIANREDITGDVKNYFQAIINESDQAAQFLRDSIGKFSINEIENDHLQKNTVNDHINSLLKKSFISEGFYQLGGSPQELNLALGDSAPIELSDDNFKSLFEAVINRFAVTVVQDDVVSIATYLFDDYLFLDISSHHKNFPAIQKVAEIGEYQIPDQAIENRPADRFLEFISGENCFYAYDKLSQIPAYLSFKFKINSDISKSNQTIVKNKKVKILAIDDQTVILDLIRAMCQTMDYQVDIAESGEKGLEMAFSNDYNLILTDLSMPGLSGLDVAKKLRATYPKLPIVLLTGWDLKLTEEELSKAGISKVLYKPFRIEQLIEIMNYYLKTNKISQ